MERTLITWTVPNWITVVLMAAAGYLVLGLLAQLIIGAASGSGLTSNGGLSSRAVTGIPGDGTI